MLEKRARFHKSQHTINVNVTAQDAEAFNNASTDDNDDLVTSVTVKVTLLESLGFTSSEIAEVVELSELSADVAETCCVVCKSDKFCAAAKCCCTGVRGTGGGVVGDEEEGQENKRR